MRIVEDCDKDEVFSARCTACWCLLKFSRNDVHPPKSSVKIDEFRVGGSSLPFVICPKCGEVITQVYDSDGLYKVSG